MFFIIIRHGESEADLLDVHEGRADFSLTERGHMQAICMANFVRDRYHVSKIYASPLKRASETAQYLAKELNLPIIADEDLMEFNNGLLAGLPRAVAAERYPEVLDLPADQAVYGQESKLEFRKRADRFLNRILEVTEVDETIAIVTHGGMINQLYRSFLGLPVGCNLFFGTGDTGIHVWKIESGNRRVIKANMTEHLDTLAQEEKTKCRRNRNIQRMKLQQQRLK